MPARLCRTGPVLLSLLDGPQCEAITRRRFGSGHPEFGTNSSHINSGFMDNQIVRARVPGAARCRRPVPAPAARGPSPRPPACGWGCAARRARPGTWRAAPSPGCRRAAGCLSPWRGYAGRDSGCPGWAAITRFVQPDAASPFAPPAARGPSPRPPRADGDATSGGCSG